MAAKKKKQQKVLTEKQRARMANDRTQELCMLLDLECIGEPEFEAAEAFILELYDADIESGKAMA